MNCKVTSHTPEEVKHIIINGGLIFPYDPDLAVDDIIDRLDYINENMKLEEPASLDEDSWYTMFGLQIRNRVSQLSSKSFEDRVGKAKAEESKKSTDNKRKKYAGIKIHKVLGELVDAKYNNNGNVDAIRTEAAKGDFPITARHYNVLDKLSDSMINQINNVQKNIDPKQKATIKVEQKVLDPVSNRGGAIDLLAVFSDKTASIYDFKTKHSWSGIADGLELTDELLGANSIQDYELSMSEYARILTERFGITNVIQNRLVPIHIKLRPKPKDQREKNDYLTNQFSLIEAGQKTSEYLAQIPMRGEETKYKGLNDLLEKQYNLISTLNKRLQKSRLPDEERQRLKAKIANLRKSIQKTIVEGEISDILLTSYRLIKEVQSRLQEPETIDGQTNPRYLTDSDMHELFNELTVYTDILKNTSMYFKDLQEQDEKLYNKLSNQVSKVNTDLTNTYNYLSQERDRRVIDVIPDRYKQADGSLGALPTIDFFSRTFNRISEIDHPIFQGTWEIIQKKIQYTRRQVTDISTELFEKQDAVSEWAKSHNMSRTTAYAKMINLDTGNLVSKLSPEFWELVNKAKELPIEEGAELLKSIFEIPDVKAFKENYQIRLRNYTQKRKYSHEGDIPAALKDVRRWETQNNLLTSNAAWLNSYNRGRLRVKPEVAEKYVSEEFAYLQQNKPLLEFYNFFTEKNKEFRKVLGISRYYDLPPNFIPNIRKEMLEFVGREGFNLKGSFREILDSFKHREEDIYLGERDANGEIQKHIPMLFVNRLRNADGEIDNTRKSYDLGESLLLFAKMAYNYQSMNEIEGTILSMKAYMADPSTDVQGTEVTTPGGRKVKGIFNQVATKAGMSTNEVQLFEQLTDYYLYGIKYKENSLTDKFNSTQFILRLKEYYSKKALAFAAIPAIGAYLAGRTAQVFEGKKGISYESKHLKQAQINFAKENQKFMALGRYFNTYAEDPLDRLAYKASIKTVKKIGDPRTLFIPLRKADEWIVNLVTNSMLLNWGINKDGKLLRLNRTDVDTTSIKPLYEEVSLNEKTGDWEFKNMNEEAYLAFRNAVKGTTTNIIGSLSHEDISQGNVNLVISLMMQFKTWMPGIARERLGKLNYDDRIQAVRWGRYRAAFNEFELTESEKNNGIKMVDFVTKILLPNIGRAVMDLLTFGLAHNVGMLGGQDYKTASGENIKVRGDINRARRRFIQYTVVENPHLQGKVSFDEFLKTRNGQLKAMLAEIRTILGFLGFLMFMGGDGEDDKPRYMSHYFTRTLHKSMSKTNSELMFMWNPKELLRIIENPMPLAKIAVDFSRTINNTMDESRDILFGENATNDPTPLMYYTIQWAYGGNQIARFFELFEQYKQTPNY